MAEVDLHRRTTTRRVGVWILVLIALRLVVVQPEHCPRVDRSTLRSSAELAVRWLVTNQHADGTWLYRYDRAADQAIDDYNIVRHAGVIWSLEQAATAGFDGADESARLGTDWARAHLTRRDGWAALGDRGRLRVGATALLAVALAERRERTGDQSSDELLVELTRFLVGQVEPAGSVLAYWDHTTGAPVPGQYSPFFTGEVWWALIRAQHQVGTDPALVATLSPTISSIGAYLATDRDEAEGYWPPVPDHWASYALAELATVRELEAQEVAHAHRLAGSFGIQVRYESQRTDSLWSWSTRGRRTLGAGLGTIGEALASLWALGERQERADDRDPVWDDGDLRSLNDRTSCVVGMLVERQATVDDVVGEPEPERVLGAWFQFDVTQMDDQQHALSAILLALDRMDEQERGLLGAPRGENLSP